MYRSGISKPGRNLRPGYLLPHTYLRPRSSATLRNFYYPAAIIIFVLDYDPNRSGYVIEIVFQLWETIE